MADNDNTKRDSRNVILAVLVAIAGLLTVTLILYMSGIFGSVQKDNAGDSTDTPEDDFEGCVLENNPDAGYLTFTGRNYTIGISYDRKFAVDKLIVNGKNVLEQGSGMFIKYAVTLKNGKSGGSFTTLSLETTPEVTVDAENYTASFRYSDKYTDNTIEISFGENASDFNITRTFTEEASLTSQAFPEILVAQDFAESIRWHRSGSNFWVGGQASGLRNFLAAGSGYRSEKISNIYKGNIVRCMEDISFTLLSGPDGQNSAAVSFLGEITNGNEAAEAVTQVQRVDTTDGKAENLPLEMSVILSNDKGVVYNGNDDGWGSYSGRDGLQGSKRIKNINFKAGDSQTVHFTVKCDDYNDYYSLGTVKGMDGDQLSKILNDYSRMMIMDWNMGTTLESCNYFMEIPALEQHWDANLTSIYNDPAAIRSEMAGLEIIRDHQQAADGHIKSPYPHVGGDGWGCDYSDMMPGYILASVYCYKFTGDTDFMNGMRESLELAVQAQLDMYIKDGVYVCRLLKQTPPDNNPLYMNDYWEHTLGQYNGYTTPMFYEALNELAAVEREVYKDSKKAAEYEEIAAKIKADYNRIMWSEETGSFLYGDESEDVVYLPVQSAAIRSGIADEERVRKMILAVERSSGVFDIKYHVMNAVDLITGNTPASISNDYHYSLLGMNGGWYGAPDGEFFAAFPIYGDRTLIPKYINGLTKQFGITGFINATCYQRNGVTPGDYGWYDLMPTMAYPIWGLYAYGYGFQPGLSQLNIAPFIDESMIGSEIKYNWRGQEISVAYNGLYDFTLTADELPTPVVISFINQTPNKEYIVSVNGKDITVKAESDGSVNVTVTAKGSTNAVLKNPDPEYQVKSGTNLSLGKPCAPSSTQDINTSLKYWSDKVTDGKKDMYWTPEADKKDGSWLRVELGGKYDLASVNIYMKDAGTYKYKVEGTSDPTFTEWTVLADHSKSGVKAEAGQALKDSINGRYNYVRVTFYVSDSTADINVQEIEIFS